jgi:transposase InsO family protein
MQGTIKERTKVLWGFKTLSTARIIINGFIVHYNYFRPHLSLNNHTPAEAAGIKSPVKNWIEFVREVG